MREDIRIRITPVLREGSFLRSEIPGRRRDVLNSVFGEEKAGKRRWPVSKEKIGGRGHRDKRGNGRKRQERRYDDAAENDEAQKATNGKWTGRQGK